jgi:hypothetical protein
MTEWSWEVEQMGSGISGTYILFDCALNLIELFFTQGTNNWAIDGTENSIVSITEEYKKCQKMVYFRRRFRAVGGTGRFEIAPDQKWLNRLQCGRSFCISTESSRSRKWFYCGIQAVDTCTQLRQTLAAGRDKTAKLGPQQPPYLCRCLATW